MYSASFVNLRLKVGEHLVCSDDLRVGLADDQTPCEGFLIGFNVFDWVLNLSKTMNVVGMEVTYLNHKYEVCGLRVSKDEMVSFKILDILSMTTNFGRDGRSRKVDIVAFEVTYNDNWLPFEKSQTNTYWAFTWHDHDDFNYGPGVNEAIVTKLDDDDKRARRYCIDSSGTTYMKEDEFLFFSQFLKARVTNKEI